MARRQSWVRISWMVAGLWFLGIYPALLLLCPLHLRDRMAPSRAPLPSDIGQYYAGGLAARHGVWHALYPLPKAHPLQDHLRFQRFIPLFKPEGMDEKGWIAAPLRLARATVSDVHPDLLALEPRLRKSLHRYIYPPPLAWLMIPLTFFDLLTLAYIVYPLCASVALLAAAGASSKIHRHLAGHPTYTEGVLMLLVVVISLAGKNHIYWCNATPFIATGLSIAALAWLRGRQVVVGCCMIPMLLLKGITLTWVPLLFLPKIRWKSLATLAVLTLALNGATLAAAGPGIYRQFFADIYPSMNTPAGSGLANHTFLLYGIFPKLAFSALSTVLTLVLYFAYYRSRVPSPQKSQGPEVLAVLAGTMALFCLFNSTVWYEYFANYCVIPFAGWVVWELQQLRGTRRKVYLACATGLAAFVYGDWILRLQLEEISPEAAQVFQAAFAEFADATLGPLFLYALALHRLLACPSGGEEPPPLPSAEAAVCAAASK